MDQKDAYEQAAAVAAALPEVEREMFANLLSQLTSPDQRHGRPFTGCRRWLRDAGWVRR
jgi:hypothetical protein